MTELSAEKLAELRKIAGNATPGRWVFSPDDGSALDADVVFALDDAGEEVSTVTSWLDANDAAHIAAVDPPTVIALLDLIAEQLAEIQRQHDALVQCGLRELRDEKRIAEQQAELAQVEAFINQRPEYVTALKNTRGGDSAEDYYRWSGHAEARRQLATSLNLTIPYEPGEKATRYEVADDE